MLAVSLAVLVVLVVPVVLAVVTSSARVCASGEALRPGPGRGARTRNN
jgi:hypothetical protein